MIGLIPAAGKARRMLGLPKMLLPTGDECLWWRLCRLLEAGGAGGQVTIANMGTWGTLSQYAPPNTVVYMHNTQTMAQTVLEARTYTGEDQVLFGMPDSYFEDEAAFMQVADGLRDHDLVVGCFKVRPEQRSQLGMVAEVEGLGPRVIDKPVPPVPVELEYAWGILGWNAAFWQHITPEMPHVGHAINPMLDSDPQRVVFIELAGGYWDCGTFPEYAHLCRTLISDKVKAI